MESINENIERQSHHYSPIQKQIINAIRDKFGEKVRVSGMPKNLREMDVSVYFMKEKYLASFIIDNREVRSENECPKSKIVSSLILEILGENPFLPLKNVEIGAIYRHMKTGREYRLLFESKVGATGSIFLNYQLAEDSNAEIWARPRDEFMDGRFQPI